MLTEIARTVQKLFMVLFKAGNPLGAQFWAVLGKITTLEVFASVATPKRHFLRETASFNV